MGIPHLLCLMDNICLSTQILDETLGSICEKMFIDSYSIYKIIVHSFQQIRRRWNFEFIELSGLSGHILERRTPPYFGDIVWKGMEQENQRQTGFALLGQVSKSINTWKTNNIPKHLKSHPITPPLERTVHHHHHKHSKQCEHQHLRQC